MERFEYSDLPINDNQAIELEPFFRSCYGNNYVGSENFRTSYLARATGHAALRHTDGRLLAARLIRNGRFTASSTTTKPPQGQYRRNLASQLLVYVRDVSNDPDLWTTIRLDSPMTQVALSAGMEPLVDPDDLYQRLVRFGEADSHVITEHSSGLSVTRTGSVHGANYVQLAWGWPATA